MECCVLIFMSSSWFKYCRSVYCVHIPAWRHLYRYGGVCITSHWELSVNWSAVTQTILSANIIRLWTNWGLLQSFAGCNSLTAYTGRYSSRKWMWTVGPRNGLFKHMSKHMICMWVNTMSCSVKIWPWGWVLQCSAEAVHNHSLCIYEVNIGSPYIQASHGGEKDRQLQNMH